MREKAGEVGGGGWVQRTPGVLRNECEPKRAADALSGGGCRKDDILGGSV